MARCRVEEFGKGYAWVAEDLLSKRRKGRVLLRTAKQRQSFAQEAKALHRKAGQRLGTVRRGRATEKHSIRLRRIAMAKRRETVQWQGRVSQNPAGAK